MKTTTHVRRVAGLMVLALSLVGAPRALAADAAAMLATVDKVLNGFGTVHYTLALSGGEVQALSLEVWGTGDGAGAAGGARLYEAKGGSAAGTLLLCSKDGVFMYTPAFKKVRKVAANEQQQGFLGSAFTIGDMCTPSLSPWYEASLSKAGALVLEPKSEAKKAGAPKLELVLDAKKRPTRVKAEGGKGARTESRSYTDKACKGLFCLPATRTMKSASGTTVMTLETHEIDGKLERNGNKVKFSKRELK